MEIKIASEVLQKKKSKWPQIEERTWISLVLSLSSWISYLECKMWPNDISGFFFLLQPQFTLSTIPRRFQVHSRVAGKPRIPQTVPPLPQAPPRPIPSSLGVVDCVPHALAGLFCECDPCILLGVKELGGNLKRL